MSEQQRARVLSHLAGESPGRRGRHRACSPTAACWRAATAGSAGDAQHFAAEMVGRFRAASGPSSGDRAHHRQASDPHGDPPRLRVRAGVRQAGAGDRRKGLTCCSHLHVGQFANVVAAIRCAHERKMTVVALTGGGGSAPHRRRSCATKDVHISSRTTPRSRIPGSCTCSPSALPVATRSIRTLLGDGRLKRAAPMNRSLTLAAACSCWRRSCRLLPRSSPPAPPAVVAGRHRPAARQAPSSTTPRSRRASPGRVRDPPRRPRARRRDELQRPGAPDRGGPRRERRRRPSRRSRAASSACAACRTSSSWGRPRGLSDARTDAYITRLVKTASSMRRASSRDPRQGRHERGVVYLMASSSARSRRPRRDRGVDRGVCRGQGLRSTSTRTRPRHARERQRILMADAPLPGAAPPGKIACGATALARIAALPRPLVFTHGVFDILHRASRDLPRAGAPGSGRRSSSP